jgi:hypothetical protein
MQSNTKDVKKNKTIQRRDYDEDDDDDDIRSPGYDIEEGYDKEEKLIGKSPSK